MMPMTVLFVDDEEDIRFSFGDYFEGVFPIQLASDGKQALEILEKEDGIGVVVTDIRMPEMNGFDLIQAAREKKPELGFIVVSGHGDADDIIQALRLGARNYLRKPYKLKELRRIIETESRRYQLFQEESEKRELENVVEGFLVSVGDMNFHLPSRMELVAPVAFRLVRNLESAGIINEEQRSNLVLSLIEILNNAIEHGNFEITGDEKIRLKTEGEESYEKVMASRAKTAPYKDRSVKISLSFDEEGATFIIEDEGEGFDFKNLPDPTAPENIFLPSGRGLLLARNFLDELIFEGKGNIVRLIKRSKNQAN